MAESVISGGAAEHSARIAAVVVLKDGRLATACHDRQLRVWCLRTFKLLLSMPDAHETPLQVHMPLPVQAVIDYNLIRKAVRAMKRRLHRKLLHFEVTRGPMSSNNVAHWSVSR